MSLLGKIVIVKSNGQRGLIEEVFPAGMYDEEELYMVNYVQAQNKGMFKLSELEILDL